MITLMHSEERIRYMIMPTIFVGILGLLSITFLSVQPLDAETGIVEVAVENGMVDWSNGVIRAVGLGFPSQKAKNETHAKATAKRAGRIVAYRNLLEIVEGIHVDSHTLVKNFMVESDIINAKVQGMVRGARVIETQSMADGSYEVTVEMKLSGPFQSTVLPPREREPEPLSFTESSVSTDSAHSSEVLVYTGLIVNAQGLDVERTMSPRLIMEDGRVVYGAEWVDPEVSKQRTVVGYIKGIPNAKSHERVIAVPLVVKAVRVDANNPSDIVINDADAQTLHLTPEHIAFLRQAKVLVVLE